MPRAHLWLVAPALDGVGLVWVEEGAAYNVGGGGPSGEVTFKLGPKDGELVRAHLGAILGEGA